MVFLVCIIFFFFFFSSRRRHTRWTGDWSSDVVLFRSSQRTATRRVRAALAPCHLRQTSGATPEKRRRSSRSAGQPSRRAAPAKQHWDQVAALRARLI